MSITTCIQESLKTSMDTSPFWILREAGLVSHIRGHLIRSIKGSTQAAIRSQPGFESHYTWNTQNTPNIVEICRVQLEIKINYPDNNATSDRTDIVVLKETGVSITCEANGPGDVIAEIDYQGVAAAIEVKACPAADGKQLLLILNDIFRLHKLATQKIESHMIIADKSQDCYGTWNEIKPNKPINRVRRLNWSTLDGPQNGILERFSDSVRNNPPEELAQLHASPNRPRNRPYVTTHIAGVDGPIYFFMN